MGYFIGAGILAVLGLIFWIIKGKRAGKSATLQMMETTRIKDVNENYEGISNSMGSGSFTNFVEVKGIAHSDTPLESELSNEKVVYFKSKVEHEYEKLEWKTDSKGDKQKKWVKHMDVVSENERWADGFGVKDDTGFVTIDPSKSKLHTEKLYSNFEKGDPNERSGGINFKIKGLSIGMGGSKDKGLRTIGYRYTEIGIRLNSNLYVVGDANDRDGSLRISKSKEKKNPFIVSVRSKDDLLGSLGSAVKGFNIGAIVCWTIAVGLVVCGIVL